MSILRSIAIITALVLMGLFTTARAEQTLTYADLVGRMTDLARLAVLPDRGETCAQWSSYDRASRYDEKTGKYVALGRQRRRRRHHPQRGRPGGHGRDERPGLHLADLVGRARQGTREDLPRRPAGAGRRPALRRLLRRQARALQLTRRCPTTWPQSVPAGRTCTCRSPIRSRARSWPTRAGATTTTSTTRPIRREPRCPTFSAGLAAEHAAALKAANDFFANELGTDPAGKRAGQKTRVRKRSTSRRARRPGWPGSTARGRSPPCGSR